MIEKKLPKKRWEASKDRAIGLLYCSLIVYTRKVCSELSQKTIIIDH